MTDQKIEEIYESFTAYMDSVLCTNSGFAEPPCPDITRKIFRVGYTPEEAFLLDGMPFGYGPVFSRGDDLTAEEWAERKGLDPVHVKKELDRLSRLGAVYDTTEEGKTVYRVNDIIDFAVRCQMWPGEYNERAMDLAPYLNQFMHAIRDNVPQMPYKGEDGKIYYKPAKYRTIPVDGTIEVEEGDRRILPNDDVMNLLETRWSYYSVSPCVCAVRYNLDPASHECEYHLERCLHMDDLGRYIVRNGMGREITLEEAKEICRVSANAGLVHSLNPPTQAGNDTVCNCCPDCCYSMVWHNKFGDETSLLESNYIATIDTKKCIGCGECVKVCPVKCLRLVFKKGAKGQIAI